MNNCIQILSIKLFQNNILLENEIYKNYLGLLKPTHPRRWFYSQDREHLYFVYRRHLKRSTTIRIRTGAGIGFHLWFCRGVKNDQEKSGFKGLIRAIMWFSFLRPRDRFSLVELRFTFSTDQGRSRNKFHFLMYLSLCCLVPILTKITNGVRESSAIMCIKIVFG